MELRPKITLGSDLAGIEILVVITNHALLMYTQPDIKDNADNISNTWQREKNQLATSIFTCHIEMIPATGNPNPENKWDM